MLLTCVTSEFILAVAFSPKAFHPLDLSLIYIPAGLDPFICPEYSASLSSTSAVWCDRTAPLASTFTVSTSFDIGEHHSSTIANEKEAIDRLVKEVSKKIKEFIGFQFR